MTPDLTPKEVAQILGCHVETIRRLVLSGELRAYKLSSLRTGQIRIKWVDLEDFREKRHHTPQHPTT